MLILGHRGTGVTMRNSTAQEDARRAAGTQGPENTLKAFELALRGGSDGLEFDVIRTADNDLAVIHDNALNRHIDGAARRKTDRGFVSNHTMSQLRQLNVGDGESVPSLRDLFALAARYSQPLLNIDLRGNDTYELAYTQVKQAGYPLDKIIFSSFDHDQLARLRALDDRVKIGMLFRYQNLLLNTAKNQPRLTKQYLDKALPAIRPTSIHPAVRNVTPAIQDYARQHNLDIYAWTHREKHPARNPASLNFARRHKDNPHLHLITDYPAEIKAGL